MDRPSFIDALRLGKLAHSQSAPDGIADYSNLLEGLTRLAAKCATVRANDEQSLSSIVAELTDLTQDERVRAIVFGLILRIQNGKLGYCPKESILDLTDALRLNPVIEELSTVGVDFTSVGGIDPRLEELSVFADPIEFSTMHRLGFAVRQLRPWTWPRPEESTVSLEGVDFDFIDAAEVEWDGLPDRLEGFEEWIDQIVEEWESEVDDDE